MKSGSIQDLLLSPQLETDRVSALLAPYGFKDVAKADGNLQQIADEPRARRLLADILEDLLICLSESPDPDQALNYLERFTRAALNKIQLLSHLKESPRTMGLLAKLFASSPFMAEILIRNPTYVYWISAPGVMAAFARKEDLLRELSQSLRNLSSMESKRNILRAFKRKEILRIGLRDLTGGAAVEETTEALSDLADVLIRKAYEISDAELRASLGGNRRTAFPAFSIIAMGKLGGRELNFSSDVDLIYIYDARGRMAGKGLDREEYIRRLSRDITSCLSAVNNEGYLYRVDLRLRPEGEAGPIAFPIQSVRGYYAARGQTWERLALIKARPVAGSAALGARFLKSVAPFIYEPAYSGGALEEIRGVKAKIDRKMTAKGQARLNVKLGQGGIREIEFIVQAVQAFFGGRIPGLLDRHTTNALRKFRRLGILTEAMHDRLAEAYRFLRNVEHKLQMVEELQTHTLPSDPAELEACALRLDYRERNGESAARRFSMDLERHTNYVNEVFRSLFGAPEESPILRAAQEAARGRGARPRYSPPSRGGGKRRVKKA